MSNIEWTDETWNPTTGCEKVSPGCESCYAIRMAYRLMHNPKIGHKYAGTAKKMANGQLNWSGKINILEDELTKPMKWKKPKRIFVDSMSDLFHKDVPFEFIDKVFAIMALTPWHTYQILTKREDRMMEYANTPGRAQQILKAVFTIANNAGVDVEGVWDVREDWYPLPNAWLGVSVETDKHLTRVATLLQVPATVRFLSMEPLLGPVDISYYLHHPLICEYCYKTHYGEMPNDWEFAWQSYICNDCKPRAEIHTTKGGEFATGADPRPLQIPGIHWVIAGGESGPKARPMHPDWVRGLRDQCQAAGVPFFFKQRGGFVEGSHPTTKEKDHYLVLNNGDFGRYHSNDVTEKYKGQEWQNLQPIVMRRVSKKAAGALLDGKEYREFPALAGKETSTAESGV